MVVTRPSTKQDTEEAFEKLIALVFKKVEKLVAQNVDDMKVDVVSELRAIRLHMAELRAEMRAIRSMLDFWAAQNLSPEIMEAMVEKKVLTGSLLGKENPIH